MGNFNEEAAICFVLEYADPSAFGFFLQQGVGLSVTSGCSLKSLLCDQFGISPEYIDSRIKTAFLNGKPVDDFDSALVGDQATLALSAAMPGLVGATFRSGGVLSPFRSHISHRNDPNTGSRSDAMVTVKLFNLLVKELGGEFLKRGVWIRPDEFKFFLGIKNLHRGFLKTVLLNDKEIDLNRVTKFLDAYGGEKVRLNIRLASAES